MTCQDFTILKHAYRSVKKETKHVVSMIQMNLSLITEPSSVKVVGHFMHIDYKLKESLYYMMMPLISIIKGPIFSLINALNLA